ncbi:MAG TPA: transporter substrate-binding domain-containing protein [Cyclobacteriaceae bacterium]|nr:transporter substrate-binding domain-containing protein [Cyclobacteriaceae bacterium]
MTRKDFFILFLLCLASCNKKEELPFAPEPLVARDLEAIRKRGYLEALVDNNSVSYFIYKGRSMGYEYELLQRLASELKVDLKVKLITGIEEAIDKLNRGEGDVIAFPLTITKERTQYVSFTDAFFNTQQVLVQKKPDHWRMLPPHVVEMKMLRNKVHLIRKEVYVINGSSFKQRLDSLSREIGGEIFVHEDSANAETESLIRKVALGEIPYTVADQMIAQVNELYYPNIDIKTVISPPQPIAWAMRCNSPALMKETNQWLAKIKRRGIFQVVHNRYFNSPRFSVTLASSDYSSLNSEKLCPYDDQLKKEAALIGWDWRLLASIAYQESNFNPHVKSWVGAIGLMQVMPETGRYFGVRDLWNPEKNISVGTRFLKFLDDYWKNTVTDEEERKKFVLASYNVGLTHVIDAQRLTKKYGKKINLWDDNVGYYLAQKSLPKYYRDPLAMAGYCRCDGPVFYVKQVLQRYEEYKIHIAA